MQNWLTIAQDDGAWDGVRDDWPTHNSKILEHVKRFNTVVQAGGHQGLYPRLLSDMFKFVYTFEPDPINFHCLVNNCQKDNIFKFNSALGDKHTMVRMNEPAKDLTTMKDNSGMNSIDVDKIGNTPQLMIDDLNLNSCDLIWLDVEGYEIRALMGAENTIDKFKPVIMAERASEEVRQYLSAWNYMQVDTSNLDCVFKVQ
jgi:FkbM family methyltransferase